MKLNRLLSLSFTPTILLAFLLPLTQFPPAESRNDDLVTQTCKNTPLFRLCLTTLRSDPRSKSSDIAGLGLIVVDAVKSKTRIAVTQIDKLKKSTTTSPHMKRPLNSCSELYNAVLVADIPSAIEALTKGDPKFAESGMVDAGNEAQFCEMGFEKGESPLSDVNRAVKDLCVVATAITRMLL